MHFSAVTGAPIELKDDNGDPAELVTKALADLGTIADRIKAVETKSAEIEAKNAKLEARLNRPVATETKGADDLELKAFAHYLRTGQAEELKTLQVGAGTGGILAPEAHSNVVIQKIIEHSPIRGLASTINMGGGLLKLPRLVSEVAPSPVGELDDRPEAEPTFEEISISPFEMAVIVPVSRILLEDSQVDLNAFLAAHLGKKFGQKEATWFVNGNGTSQAEGVLTNTEIGVNEVEVLDADALIDTFYSIKSAYSARGSWVMSRAVMSHVRKLKDSTGAYLWQPAISASAPPTILGRPVYESHDMAGPTAGSIVAAFGDFAEGYMIADRVGLEINADAVTGWANGIVKIQARRRVGGRVVLPEALTKLKIAAA